MEGKVAKEALIIVLLLIVVLFVLGILLYDFIPGSKENIKSVEYVAEDSVSNVLKEIEDNTGIDLQGNSSDVPLKSYSIGSEDLEEYASDNSYESGKSDPFAEESNPAEKITRAVPTETKKEQEKTTKEIETKKEEKESVVPKAEVANTTSTAKTDTKAQTNTVKAETETKAKTEDKKEETKKEDKSTSSTGKYFEKSDKK